MPRIMNREQMIQSFWPDTHKFMTKEEMEKLQAKGIVYQQVVVPLSDEEKKEVEEMLHQESKAQTEEKCDLS